MGPFSLQDEKRLNEGIKIQSESKGNLQWAQGKTFLKVKCCHTKWPYYQSTWPI